MGPNGPPGLPGPPGKPVSVKPGLVVQEASYHLVFNGTKTIM